LIVEVGEQIDRECEHHLKHIIKTRMREVFEKERLEEEESRRAAEKECIALHQEFEM